GRGDYGVDDLGPAVDAKMGLHAEVPLVALLGLVHVGITALSAFLVEDGAVMIVASTMVPVETFNPFASRCRWAPARGPGRCRRNNASQPSRRGPLPPPD